MIDYGKYNEPPFPLTQGDIVQDYLMWSNEDEWEVASKIAHFRARTKDDYHTLGKEFYLKSDNYIYDILGGNPSKIERANLINKFIPNGMEILKQHPGQKFADFGGGVGAICSIMAEYTDKEINHIDIPSKLLEFARWRYYDHKERVKVVEIPEENFTLPENYDLILTDAVWEHLTPAAQLEYAVRLTNYLNPNGLFFLLIDLSGESVEMPMHYNVDIVKLHNVIEANGLALVYGRNNFASVWEKK